MYILKNYMNVYVVNKFIIYLKNNNLTIRNSNYVHVITKNI